MTEQYLFLCNYDRTFLLLFDCILKMNQDDIPLTNAFYENPLDYMQNYVRNLNNEIFLS